MYDFIIRQNSKFEMKTITSLVYIKLPHLSLLALWQNNLSNLDIYSEPFQAPNCQEEVFFKNNQRLKVVDYFHKTLHIRH